MTAQDAYEEFRCNFECNKGEERPKPWSLLTPLEKNSWEEQWLRHTNEADGMHEDPWIVNLHKTRA